MELKTSQLDYIKHRKKSYNLKYAMVKEFIKDLKPNCNILELFGGLGITTSLIHSCVVPKEHYIIELDDECFKVLEEKQKKLKINLEKKDAFIHDNFFKFDYIFSDNIFNKKIFEKYLPIFEKIRSQNKKAEVFLTETGIFNIKFTGKTPKQHYKELNKELNKQGFYIKRVLFTSNFSIIHLVQNPTDIKIERWTKEDSSWRDYI